MAVLALIHLIFGLFVFHLIPFTACFADDQVKFESSSVPGQSSSQISVPVSQGKDAPPVYYFEDPSTKAFATGESATALTERSPPSLVPNQAQALPLSGRDVAIIGCSGADDQNLKGKCLAAIFKSKYIDLVGALTCILIPQANARLMCFMAISDRTYDKDPGSCLERPYPQEIPDCMAQKGRPVITVTEVHELHNQSINVVNGVLVIRKLAPQDGESSDPRANSNREKILPDSIGPVNSGQSSPDSGSRSSRGQ